MIRLPRPVRVRWSAITLAGILAASMVLDARSQANASRPDASALPSPALQEAPSLRFERLGLEDGLAQVSIQAMMQDRQGYLWFGTQSGLHRYDGHTFEVFAPVPFDTTSLSSGYIASLAGSADGSLWVGLHWDGLNRFDPATGRAVHYRHDPSDAGSLAHDAVRSVLEAANGDVWVGTYGGGLDRMRADRNGRFEHLRHDPDDPASLSSDYVLFLSEDAEGYVWASTPNGTNRIDPRTGAVRRFLHVPDVDRLTNINRYAAGAPYHPAGTPGVAWLPTSTGLVRLDVETGGHERFLVAPDAAGPNPRNQLYQVTPDPHDAAVLWAVGPAAGLVRFDTRTGTFSTYRNDPRDAHSLGDNYATRILADRSGTVWVGTMNQGLNVFNPKSANFVHLRHSPNDAKSLAPGAVFGLYEDRTGSLWAGTEESRDVNYLTRFDSKTKRVTHYRHDPNNAASLQPGVIVALTEDGSGHLWIGHSAPGGLSRLDGKTGRITRFNHPRTPENARRNRITYLVPTRSDPDVLWIGTWDGLDRFDTRTGTFERIALDLGGLVQAPLAVRTLLEDPDGTLWLSIYGAGLVRIREGTLHIASTYDPRDTTSVSSNEITDIMLREEAPDVLWLSTMTGLNRFDVRTGKATHYRKEDGLADNVVYGIMEDQAGTLWMSTNGGIANFDPETGTFRNYGLDDGLMALEYNDTWAEGAGGVMYFGSMEGVTAFSPASLTTNTVPPEVVLKTFKLFNRPVAAGPDSPLARPLADTERITLAHDQNEVAFEFVALHFGNPSKNRYAYRLEGYDDDWIEAGAEHRTASYTNLPPGHYRFRVKAANPDGVWNEAGATVALTILPPWWRTPWAYALFATLFGLGVFTVDRLQRRRLARQERARAQVREAELHARAQLREAELRVEAQARRREDAERLSEIGRAITSRLSIREVIDTIYEHVNALMDSTVFGIGIYNPTKNRIEFRAMKERGETLPPFTNDLDDDSRPAVWCFKNGQAFIVGDFAKEYQRYLPARSEPVAGDDASSIIYLPLVYQDKKVGVITTQSFEKNAYTEYNVSVLSTLATYAAIALDNAESYRQLDQAVHRLDATVNELRTTQEQLVQQEKLASLGALTAGIAHEIKNPLNFINNFSSLSAELVGELEEALRTEDHEEVAALLSDLRLNVVKIEEHGRRADGIVQSMMAHARGGEGKRERVAINTLVEEYVDLAYHGQRARVPGFSVDVARDYGQDVGTAELVPQEVGRVVLNLVANAFDALAEHAASRNGTYAPTLRVATRRKGERVEVRIEDNGPGIPAAVRERIFEPFFTTKPTGAGTGLGLSMSHDIITKGHGGTLEVQTEEGRGTAFIVTLPAHMRPSEGTRSTDPLPEAATLHE